MNIINRDELIKTDLVTRLTVDGIIDIYDVYKIKLDKLYYNDQNDRIATWISKYKADNHLEAFDLSNIEEYNLKNTYDKYQEKVKKETVLMLQKIKLKKQ